jgi:hypothetical protein
VTGKPRASSEDDKKPSKWNTAATIFVQIIYAVLSAAIAVAIVKIVCEASGSHYMRRFVLGWKMLGLERDHRSGEALRSTRTCCHWHSRRWALPHLAGDGSFPLPV